MIYPPHIDSKTAKAIIDDMTDYGYDEHGKWHDPNNPRPLWQYIALGACITIPVWAIAIWAIVRFFCGE